MSQQYRRFESARRIVSFLGKTSYPFVARVFARETRFALELRCALIAANAWGRAFRVAFVHFCTTFGLFNK